MSAVECHPKALTCFDVAVMIAMRTGGDGEGAKVSYKSSSAWCSACGASSTVAGPGLKFFMRETRKGWQLPRRCTNACCNVAPLFAWPILTSLKNVWLSSLAWDPTILSCYSTSYW